MSSVCKAAAGPERRSMKQQHSLIPESMCQAVCEAFPGEKTT